MEIVCQQCGYRFERVIDGGPDEPADDEPCPECGRMIDLAEQVARVTSRTTDHAGPEGRGDVTGPDVAHRSLGHYEILEEISRGAMGVVYKARHQTLHRVVALKVMIAGEHASPDQVTRFEKEARAAAKLRHPNIVPIYDIGVEEGHRFFTMDFVEGTPLDVLIGRQELTPRRALEIAAEIADALAYAHARGVIHRDVKPSNIMVDGAGRAQIMDFGLAKQLDSDTKFTKTGTTIGTPSYMSPEQARGENERIDQRSDVYSLGAVTYEMLTGSSPFTGETMMNIVMKVIHDDPVPPRRINPKLHRDIQTIVLKAMEKDPGRRYPGMAELAADIRRYMAGEMILARPAGPLRRAGKLVKKYRSPIIVGLVIAGVATLVSGAVIHVLVRRQQEAQLRAEQAERDRVLGAADQKPEWVVKFTDDFGQREIGAHWKPSDKAWRLADGQLVVDTRRASYITLDRAFKGKLNIEFSARALSPDARINCFLGGGYRRAAYALRFGAWGGNTISLLHRGRPLAQVACSPIQPDERYRFRIERRNTSLVCRVTGGGRTHELRYDDPALIRGLSEVKFGLDTWAAKVAFDDIKISREEFTGEKLNRLQAVDSLYFSRGQIQEALTEYRAMIAKHSGNPIAVLAEHNCGLITEALAQDRQPELAQALSHYRNVEKNVPLLKGQHASVVVKNKERIFFVLVHLGRYQEAADALATMGGGGDKLDAGSVWQFPAILSGCANELAYAPALQMMEAARFDGPHPTLQAQWEAAGEKVRTGFAAALKDVCKGFVDQKNYEAMKQAFVALPDAKAAAPLFERGVGGMIQDKDEAGAIGLLTFCHEKGVRNPGLERHAVQLAQQFVAAKQYDRLGNIHRAYPSRGMVKHFNRAVIELVQADQLTEAVERFTEACERFSENRRGLQDAAGTLMTACNKAGHFYTLRRVYEMYGDRRQARRLTEGVASLLKAGDLEGAHELLEYIRANAPGHVSELGRLAAELALKFAPDHPENVLELARDYPTGHMAAAFAAAIEAASKGEDRGVLERLMTRALARFPSEAQVARAARHATAALSRAGAVAVAARAYTEAAKNRSADKAAAGAILLAAGGVMLGSKEYAPAAAAYAAAAGTLPKGAEGALLRAAVIYGHVGERERAAKLWRELTTGHPKTAEAKIAQLMSGAMDRNAFRAWHKRHVRELPPAEADFFVALSAASDPEARALARQLLGKLAPAVRNAWFGVIAQEVLDRLPAPEPPAPPGG